MRHTHLQRCLLATAISTTPFAEALASNFTIGELQGQFDSALSIGTSWGTQSPSNKLIDITNGGSGFSSSGDDGRLNFKKGETFSKIFKGVHDLELSYGETRAFVRGKYWYDFETKDENRPYKQISDDGREMSARSSGAQILDAFVSQRYELAEHPGDVRLGKQVVSWGESLFIGNSINSINPLDVAALRRPGSELKEGLIPVNMFYLSQGITDNLSLEAFYQLQWKPYALDNCGTFFGADPVAKGCDNNLNGGLAGVAPLEPIAAAAGLGFGISNPEGVIIRRENNNDPRDSGQYGMALHWLGDGVEYGAYYMNYHSRAPKFSLRTASGVTNFINNDPAFAALDPEQQFALGLATGAGNTHYFLDYPEDIHLYGASFATELPTGTAWSGEISYRPNAPVQLNSTDILFAGIRPLGNGNANNPLTNASLLSAAPGTDLHGYRRKEVTQFQTTLTHFFDQVMGASRLTLVGEVGVTHVGGLESTSDVRYGRDPVYGPGELPASGALDTCVALNTSTINGAGPGAATNNRSRNCTDEGFTTATSWGYRGRAIWEYNDVFAGVNLKPNVAWSHDVSGYSPGPGGNFEEGRKAVSLGVDAEYQNTYTASLAYTNFFDGKYTTVDDRDFVALSVGVNF